MANDAMVNTGRQSEQLVFVVPSLEVDWFSPFLAGMVVGLTEVGLIIGAAALIAGFVSAKTLTIGLEGGVTFYSVTRLWQRARGGSRSRAQCSLAPLDHWFRERVGAPRSRLRSCGQ